MKNLLTCFFFLVISIIGRTQSDSALRAVLPLQVSGLEAKAANNNIQLLWTVNSNEDAKSFEVERSSDGVSFQKIGGKLSNGRIGTEVYEFVDAFLKKTSGFSYRIKIIARDGDVHYSVVREVPDDKLQAVLKQNPVRYNIELQLSAEEPALLQANIYSPYGQKLKTELVKLTVGVNTINLTTQNLPVGLYRLVLECTGKRQVISFVKE